MSNKSKIVLVVGAMFSALQADMANAKDEAGKEELLDRLLAGLKETEEAYNALTAKFNELAVQADASSKQIVLLQHAFDTLREESENEITSLSQQLLKAKEIADAADPGFDFDGVSYRVIGKEFTYKHKRYTVEDLLADEELQEELLDKQVGFIVPREPAGE